MARAKFRSHEDDTGEIDLTPMLDVVFIMLIFFIVTASFVKEKGLELNRPDSTDSEPNPDNVSIVLFVSNNNRITLDNRIIDIRSVRANIQRMAAENPEAPVVISAENDAQADTLVRIADAAREAGIYSVSLVKQ